MNAIIGMAHIGKSSGDSKRKDYSLDRIEDASKHLLGIINDILDMSKIEAGKFELSLNKFNVEQTLLRALNVIRPRADEKEQTITVDVDKKIPKNLVGDDTRFAQVLINIVGNAIKFTPEEGLIEILAELISVENEVYIVQVSVSDTGIGITAEQQSKLFDSFHQAESSTMRNFGGTGLGLSISKRIIEMMGGRIWIKSELGKGATFGFTIRLTRDAEIIDGAGAVGAADDGAVAVGAVDDGAADDGADDKTAVDEAVFSSSTFVADEAGVSDTADAVSQPLHTDTFEGRSILLAEDVDINREIVLSLLEETLLEIDCADNGAEAVRMFTESPDKYDMIFMDLQMPIMDGYEATRTIRSLGTPNALNIPIVAMTANVFKEDVEKCIASGMNAHMGKPINIVEIIGLLQEYLG